MSKINRKLICPACSFSLKKCNSVSLNCTNENCSFSKNGFKIINNIPVVIPFYKSDCIFDDKTFNKSQNLGFV